MEKAMITVWPENLEKMNQIRGDLLQRGKKLKQSTLINLILEKYFQEHPETVENPDIFVD